MATQIAEIMPMSKRRDDIIADDEIDLAIILSLFKERLDGLGCIADTTPLPLKGGDDDLHAILRIQRPVILRCEAKHLNPVGKRCRMR